MGFVYLRFRFRQLNPREFISVANLTTWYCACYLFKLKSLLFIKILDNICLGHTCGYKLK